jgi:hypothetical protein
MNSWRRLSDHSARCEPVQPVSFNGCSRPSATIVCSSKTCPPANVVIFTPTLDASGVTQTRISAPGDAEGRARSVRAPGTLALADRVSS